MASPYADPIQPKAGMIYRAPSKCRGGYRFVKVVRVYRPALALHVCTVREVTKSGRDLRPDYVHDGIEISTSFDHACDTDGTFGYPYELTK